LQPDELEEFRDFILPDLKPAGKNSGRAPLTIEHPMCELFSIGNVIVDDIAASHPEPGGLMTVKIDCLEWAEAPAPVKQNGKVKSTGNSGAAGTPQYNRLKDQLNDNPVDPWEEIDRLAPPTI